MDHDAIVEFIDEEIETLTLLCTVRPQHSRLFDEDGEIQMDLEFEEPIVH